MTEKLQKEKYEDDSDYQEYEDETYEKGEKGKGKGKRKINLKYKTKGKYKAKARYKAEVKYKTEENYARRASKCVSNLYYDIVENIDTDLPTDPEPEPPGPVVRKDQANMTDAEKTRFRVGIEALITNGFFGIHVGYHANMGHRMHGSMGLGFIGFERFLPWHRLYLAKLGEALRAIDEEAFIPYWKWTVDREIPDWLQSFTPSVTTASVINVTRSPGTHPLAPALPDQQSIDNIMGLDDWLDFRRQLEGVPFGAHNQVHVWVGGTMSQVPVAPADPLFWLHHCEIDRLWHEWQQTHPGQNPTLIGADAVMDPWSETVDQVLDIADLNYSYE